MKILHTSDWHIGKLVHGVHMTEDQKFLLNELIKLIEIEKPDVMIIAGDIYDRSIPPIEAVELLDKILSDILLKYNTKIIVISGNHDSPDRLGFGSKLLKDNGLFISGNLYDKTDKIELEDEYGIINFYPIPFSEPSIVKSVYKDESIKSHDLAMKAIIDKIEIDIDYNQRNICIAHGFVMGTKNLETSESERPLSIGGSEYIDVDYFKNFDYVALGHLHRPQKVKYDYIRYAGSLLKYSFSEAKQSKSVTIINIGKKGDFSYDLISLNKSRDMRIIKGELKDLIDNEVYSDIDDYIMAILTDRGELIDPIGSLRSIYPNILKLEREIFTREAGEDKTSAGEIVKKSSIEIFEEFYENMSLEKFTDEKKAIVSSIINEINKDERYL